jgi:ParB/RepB/Spo0J family partition protein
MTENMETQQTGRGIVAPIGLLEVEDGFNVREDTSPEKEFLSSIKAHGVLRPLHVRNNPKKPGYFFIVDGERRFNAAVEAEIDEVPIIPEGDMKPVTALVMSLVANDGSKPLTSKEEATAFTRLKEAKISVKEIAQVMGRSKRKVEETLRALESGDEDLSNGVTTDNPKEKIPPRAAARAATLPAETRKGVVPALKGKNARDGVKLVRQVEKEAGITRRGRKAKDYPWARDAKGRAEILEKAAKQILKGGVNRRAEAHMEIIQCLKGKTEVGDLYLELQPEEKAEAKTTKRKATKKKTKKKAATKKKATKRKATKKKASKKKATKKKASKKAKKAKKAS